MSENTKLLPSDVKVKELGVSGKMCKDCGRKYIVRKMILDKYHEVEG